MARITMNDLAKYVADELEKGSSAQVVSHKLASYLLEERRSRDLPAVLRAIDEEHAKRGSAQVTITSAHEVTEQTKKQLAELLGVTSPIYSEVIDASVIGGVKARSGETEIDLTVRARLNNFKTSIVNQG
jgi:F0F1-type ATP synthase delta subunit